MKHAHKVFLLLTFSLMSLITGISVMYLRYFTIGYVTDAEDHSIAGMQIWDIHHVFVVLLIATVLTGLIALLWTAVFKKQLSNLGLLALLIFVYLASIVFFPNPFEFQLRHYSGSANSTYINLTGDSADFIDGNEGIFMGKQQKIETEVIYAKLPNGENDYAKEQKPYDCVSNQSYWFGHIGVLQNFYPGLDDKNGDKLIKQNCKPAKIIVQ